MAVALILHRPGAPFQYWVRTGLTPVTRAAAESLLPLSHALIEELSRAAQARPEGEVVLEVSIQVLALTQEQPSTLDIHWHQQPQPVMIDAPKWQTMLRQWGNPAMRLVPIYTELPDEIGGSKAAREAWSAACTHLRTAHGQWVAGRPGDAGEELRHVVQLAIRTWGAIWYPDNPPGDGEEWAETARRLGQAIPEVDVRGWAIRRTAPNNAQRAFAILTLLRNLNTIANPFHHVGSAPVYTRADTDMLLTATTAIMRGLPEFWQQFPAPMQATAGGAPQPADLNAASAGSRPG